MRRAIPLGLALLALGGCRGLGSPVEDPAPVVTYVANEGFLVEAAGKKVLVDALFGDETIDWCDVPGGDVRARLAGARPPFDDVDVLLVTHDHVDHFEPALLLAHLAANEQGVLVAPPPVVVRLRAHPSWSERFAPRVEELDLEFLATGERTVRGVRVTAHRVRHCRYMIEDPRTGVPRNKHEDVENLAYVVAMGDTTFLHLGDAFLDQNREVFTGPGFAPGEIDLVFLEGWTPASLAILRESLAPRHVVFMHLPADEAVTSRIVSGLHGAVPNGMAFGEALESRRFTHASDG